MAPVLQSFYLTLCKADTTLKRHLCPGLHAAAMFVIFRLLTKNRKNYKVGDWILRGGPCCASFILISSTFYKADTTFKNGHLKLGPAFLYSFSVTSSKDLFTWRWGASGR